MIWGDSQVFFWLHIRPLLVTFDSQPLDLSFVQPSGASLPSTEIGIPSRCSHPRGISIVFLWQRGEKKNHTLISIPCEPHCINTLFFFSCTWFSSPLCPLASLVKLHISLLAWWGNFQRISVFWGRIWNLSASLFPSSLIYNISWASCQPLLTPEIKVLPLSFFMNILQLPSQITRAPWLWYGCPPK